MEILAKAGMVVLFLVTALSMGSCGYFMYQLVSGLKPNSKYIAPLFGPFAFLISSFFVQEAQQYIAKFWLAVFVFGISASATMYFAKACFPGGIETYVCQQNT